MTKRQPFIWRARSGRPSIDGKRREMILGPFQTAFLYRPRMGGLSIFRPERAESGHAFRMDYKCLINYTSDQAGVKFFLKKISADGHSVKIELFLDGEIRLHLQIKRMLL
jgi:hypothetical protein